MIGRSGSGKSTLLRCINGLEAVQAGRIVVDGIEVTAPGADLNLLRQRAGMVFQSYNLFPHLTVERNITLALTLVRKLDKRDRPAEIAREMVAKVGLADKLARLSRRAFGRPAAARRDRPLAGDAAGGHAVRRDHLGARSRSWSARCCACWRASPARG